LKITDIRIIIIIGMYTFTMSAIILLSQYEGKLIPEINYICLKFSTLSIKIKPIIAHGRKAKANPTNPEYKKAFCDDDL